MTVNYRAAVKSVRDAFNSGRTRPYEFRKKQLENLLGLLTENEDKLLDALYKDLRKSKQEAVQTEIDFERNDVRHAIFSLEEWMKEKPVSKTLLTLMETVYIRPEPYGVALIIGAWNYPVQVTISPLVGAIAAGNCAIIKPSEMAPATAAALAELVPKYLDNDCFPVIQGGKDETTELLKERFDYIFYTGSPVVGKIVHAAASKHLTPCTLELGGKSPAYVDESSDLNITTRRLLWGKFTNSGQTCIAPDYVLCSKSIQERMVELAKVILKEWYGDDTKASPDYGRMINEFHFRRVMKLLDASRTSVSLGGESDIGDLYIEPTLLLDVPETDPIMQEEIFGPILPFVTVNSVDEAIAFINKREKPLTMYPFASKRSVLKEILARTSAGSVCCNDTLIHMSVETLPFGGVGNSGYGYYHGAFTFQTLSHMKPILIRNFSALGESLAASRYPPYSESKINHVAFIVKKRKPLKLLSHPYLLTFFLGVLTTLGILFGWVL